MLITEKMYPQLYMSLLGAQFQYINPQNSTIPWQLWAALAATWFY